MYLFIDVLKVKVLQNDPVVSTLDVDKNAEMKITYDKPAPII